MKKLLAFCLPLAFLALGGLAAPAKVTAADSSITNDDRVTPQQITTVLNGSATDPTKEAVRLTQGAGYTTSIKSAAQYTDTDTKELTDGAVATDQNFTDPIWSGYATNGQDLVVEMNLGKDVADISRIGANLALDQDASIGVPAAMEVWAANAQHDYALVGKNIPAADAKLPAGNTYTAAVTLQQSITAQRIKLVFKNPRHAWIFLSEVYADKLTGVAADPMEPANWPGYHYYPEVTLPMTNGSQTTDQNPQATVNLAAGLHYGVAEKATLNGPDAVPWFNSLPAATPAYPNDANLSLTDGKYAAKPDMGDDPLQPWFRFTRGESRDVYFDLGRAAAISGVKIGFLKQTSKGIRLPRNVDVYLSNDGQNWMPVFYGKDYQSKDADAIVRRTDNFDKPYAARYVKIEFEVAPHIYTDEIEILGKQSTAGASTLTPQPEPQYPNAYASPTKFGLQNTMLAYIPGDPSDKQGVPRTVDWYKPYTAYMQNGQIKDTMFDSFLMLPYLHFLYDGENKRPLTKKDWQGYITNQFADQYNVSALNQAVGETKAALNKPDYQASVILPLFYPVQSVKDFGIVNGRHLNFANKQDRYLALQWMVDEQLKEFQAKGYKNLKLNGFYWFTEELDNGDPEMESILQQLTDYVREKGYMTSWIPYFQGSGYQRWQEMGFDLAIYQPGYAFDASVPKARLYETAAKAKQLGMGTEFEVEGVTPTSVTRFKDYLYAAARNGTMTDAVHMYYQGSVDGAVYDSYQSKDPYLHSLYNDTYKFVHNQFTTAVAAPTAQWLTGKENGTISGTITGTPTTAIKGYQVVLDPKFGSVSLTADGHFTYTPIKGYVGSDSISVIYDYGYQQSAPTTITFNVQ
ncbi:DUF4855 domain-containing protein [Schleiferilactobacillus harbinensis]|jgi:hypothetical protein|uniref:DUF4855 domain-containing protein n=1 Tax=Schleiferilactobacillus harbinensis TaxID=304207 RepID=UPI00242F5223|nr:DUF4855 domain-containing protein [Schleiferilactobacillus harbinensis]MCI1686521.1 DUF4855 domain-containing protein [Schleiferilactobacillus harbinensis]MCI1782832.1 DUF4855 domain-containing protein [Schleiferilactobacillus harbinensis]MCI1850793.1 DUF4855 domain-containing protein [Schleiferilactobacillus harbinensis]